MSGSGSWAKTRASCTCDAEALSAWPASCQVAERMEQPHFSEEAMPPDLITGPTPPSPSDRRETARHYRPRQEGPRQRIRSQFRELGPGLITGAADDDPSGIATYS